MADKAQAHIRYIAADGTIVPSATTVLSVLAKPALIPWANKLGLRGIDVRRYVDERAAIGTLAHQMIHDHLAGRETDAGDYSARQIDAAENAVLSYLEWERRNPISRVVLSEVPLVSEAHRYGGTPDILCESAGRMLLLDFKTGSGIYDEHVYQVAAYWQLLAEHGHRVDEVRLLNIPRTEDERFAERVLKQRDLETGWQVFLHCLAIYKLIRRRD